MPIFQKLINLDMEFSRLSNPPLIINDILDITDKEKENIRDLISTTYSSDMLSILPSCRCGSIKGEYAIGVLCEKCNTTVRSILDDNIEPILWFRAPEGVRSLMNPHMWIMLRNRLSKSGFDVLQWMCDTSYRARVKQPIVINHLEEMGFKRGYNFFVDNFDNIIKELLSLKYYKPKKGKRDFLYELIQSNRDCVFSQYIPLPNKAVLIIEKTNMGVFVDPMILKVLDAIRMVEGIDTPTKEFSVRTKENRTVKAIAQLCNFYDSYYGSRLSPKEGIFRKHVFGSRTHFSFRAVVSSLTDRHSYDEVHIPWGIAITSMVPHLINKLLKRGYDYNQSMGFLYAHIETYHPLIESLFKELLNESKGARTTGIGYIPVLMQRNPSMSSGSALLARITRIKTNPSDHTCSISIMAVKSMNCDFDGDELNFSLAIDSKMEQLWYNMSPHKNVLTLDSPRQISGNISMPKPVVGTIANYIENGGGREFTPEQKHAFDMFVSRANTDT